MSKFNTIFEMMELGFSVLRNQVDEESKPQKSFFGLLKKEPSGENMMTSTMMLKGYQVALAYIKDCNNEPEALSILQSSIYEFEKQHLAAANGIDKLVRLGMLKGNLWALLNFHQALKSLYGNNYQFPDGGETTIKAILTKWDLPAN